VNFKKLTSFGIAVVLALAMAAPLFAQGGENNDYQAIKDERDARKLISLMENFLSKYQNSGYRPEIDIKLMASYINNKDWQLAVRHADAFVISQGAADSKSKTTMFTLAMEASRQLKNTAKFNEFAGKALDVNPDNMSVLMTLVSNSMNEAPNDDAGRKAAMDKALGYAQRAKKVARPESTNEAEWAGTQTRLHGYLAIIYFNKNSWAEAGPEFKEYLEKAPDDGLMYFRYGFGTYAQLQSTLAALGETNTKAQAAQAAGKADEVTAYIERLTALTKEFEDRRDIIIDAMAGALAMGGAFAPDADKIFDPLFRQKHDIANSPETKAAFDAEKIKFISAKKAEITTKTAALAPPPAAGARGAAAGTPAFGGGAGGGGGAPAGGGRAGGR